jgi:hypothetical protein
MTGDGPVPKDLAPGLLVVGAGALVAAFPGLFATMDEATDAVGSKRSDVQPTRWKVLLVRLVGVGIALGGVWFLVSTYGPGV